MAPRVVSLRNADTQNRLQAGDPTVVRVDRFTKWGNPWVMDGEADRERVISQHRDWFLAQPTTVHAVAVEDLRGKDLACWCAPKACHADVLLEFVNATLKEAT